MFENMSHLSGIMLLEVKSKDFIRLVVEIHGDDLAAFVILKETGNRYAVHR